MKLARVTAPWIRRAVGQSAFVRHVGELEANQWKSRDELLAIQWQRLRTLLCHAAETTPHYRALFRELGMAPEDIRELSDLEALPPLQKSTLREAPESLLSERFERRALKRVHTSGSTGSPVTVYQDADCDFVSRAGTLRFNRWAGMDWGTRVASMWTRPLRVGRYRKVEGRFEPIPAAPWRRAGWRLSDALAGGNPERYCSPFGFDDADLQAFCDALLPFRPRVLYGYPNVLVRLARFVETHRIPLRFEGVLCGGEVLGGDARELFREVFGARVHTRYGTNEVGSIAGECERGGLHINEDNMLVESVLQPGSDAPSLLLTPLRAFGMPLLRYEIGDIARRSERACPCGRGLALLEGLEGRTAGILKTADGKHVMSSWIKYLMYDAPSVAHFQVRQRSHHDFLLTVVPTRPGHLEELAPICERIREKFGPETRVEIETVDAIQQDRSGKYHYIRSDV